MNKFITNKSTKKQQELMKGSNMRGQFLANFQCRPVDGAITQVSRPSGETWTSRLSNITGRSPNSLNKKKKLSIQLSSHIRRL
jgi:hypothetical protein